MPDSKTELNLSYVLVTYNKLSYLKTILKELTEHRKEDEEIVVVDGGSTDGSAEYVREMFERGNIQQFVSEKDLGLGHAINKGFLMARGALIKNISDDDVYYWDEMQKCKVFMLEHPEIDAIGSNGTQHDGQIYRREEDFLMWKKGYHPFMIAELGLILRRSSIAIFGLADTSFFFWDGEFTIRLTAGKARMAWYTGLTWEHCLNEQSSSNTKGQLWAKESARIRQMYPGLYSPWRHYVPKPIRTLIRYFKPKKHLMPAEESAEPKFLT